MDARNKSPGKTEIEGVQLKPWLLGKLFIIANFDIVGFGKGFQ